MLQDFLLYTSGIKNLTRKLYDIGQKPLMPNSRLLSNSCCYLQQPVSGHQKMLCHYSSKHHQTLQKV